MKEIVGEEWDKKETDIMVNYENENFQLNEIKMNKYIVLKRKSEEIIKIVKIYKEMGIPYAVRGNGSSVYGEVFMKIVIEKKRMKGIDIEREKWNVNIEEGVNSFDLKKEEQRMVTGQCGRDGGKRMWKYGM